MVIATLCCGQEKPQSSIASVDSDNESFTV